MNKCIYIKNPDKALTYTSGEHIFAAAIGGMKKLPNGYVSDEANNAFSKFERIAIHESFIQINRTFSGIGKRGKRDEKSVIQSAKVILFEDKGKFELGYILSSKPMLRPIVIPQFFFNTDNNIIDKATVPPDMQNADLLDFFKQKWKGLYEKIIEPKLEDKCIFGYHADKWYLAIPKKEYIEHCNRLISLLLATNGIAGTSGIKQEHQVLGQYRITIDDNYYRMVAKTAFNYFASLAGQDIMLNDTFDEVRDFILKGGNSTDFVAAISHNEVKYLPLEILTNHNFHYVIANKIGNELIVIVSIFGMAWGVRLSKNFILGDIDDEGFICDTEKRCELILGEYLIKYLGNRYNAFQESIDECKVCSDAKLQEMIVEYHALSLECNLHFPGNPTREAFIKFLEECSEKWKKGNGIN